MSRKRSPPKVWAAEVREFWASHRPDWCPEGCGWLGRIVGYHVQRDDGVAYLIVYPTKELAMRQVRRERQSIRRLWKKNGWL